MPNRSFSDTELQQVQSESKANETVIEEDVPLLEDAKPEPSILGETGCQIKQAPFSSSHGTREERAKNLDLLLPTSEQNTSDNEDVQVELPVARSEERPTMTDPFASIRVASTGGHHSAIQRSEPSSPGAGLKYPRSVRRGEVSDEADRELARKGGRPRLPLVRTWQDSVSADIPPAEFPVAYYGPDGVPPPAAPNRVVDHPEPRFRLKLPQFGLIKRWRDSRDTRLSKP